MKIYCLLIIILIIIILYKNNYIDRYTDYNKYDKYPIATSEGVSYLSNDGDNNVMITHDTTTGTPEYTGVNYKFVDRLEKISGALPSNDNDIESIKSYFSDINDWNTLMKARVEVGGLPNLWELSMAIKLNELVSTNRNDWGEERKNIYDKVLYYHYKKNYKSVKFCEWRIGWGGENPEKISCQEHPYSDEQQLRVLWMLYTNGLSKLYYDFNPPRTGTGSESMKPVWDYQSNSSVFSKDYFPKDRYPQNYDYKWLYKHEIVEGEDWKKYTHAHVYEVTKVKEDTFYDLTKEVEDTLFFFGLLEEQAIFKGLGVKPKLENPKPAKATPRTKTQISNKEDWPDWATWNSYIEDIIIGDPPSLLSAKYQPFTPISTPQSPVRPSPVDESRLMGYWTAEARRIQKAKLVQDNDYRWRKNWDKQITAVQNHVKETLTGTYSWFKNKMNPKFNIQTWDNFKNWAIYWDTPRNIYDPAGWLTLGEENSYNEVKNDWLDENPQPDVEKINKHFSNIEKNYFNQITNYLTVRVSEKQSTYKYIIKIVTKKGNISNGFCDLKYTYDNKLDILGTDKPDVIFPRSVSSHEPKYQFGYYQNGKIHIKTDVTNIFTYAYYNNTLYTATASQVTATASSEVTPTWKVQIKKPNDTFVATVTFDKNIIIHLLHVTNDSIYLITSAPSASPASPATGPTIFANIHKFPNTNGIFVTGETGNNGSKLELQNNKQIIDYDIGPETDNIIIVQ